MRLARGLASEGVGTAFLLAVVVGSGIMADRLAGGNAALALLANALATGAGLAALILAFSHAAGPHFNPLVSFAEAIEGRIGWGAAAAYGLAQTVGAFAGVAGAHAMFGLPPFMQSAHVRSGWPMLWSEFVATAGLLLVVQGTPRHRPAATPFAVGAYITSAYWFTASTSFANPAVTLARAFTPTFAGIRLADTPGFIAAELFGALAAVLLGRWMYRVPASNR